MTMPNPMSPLVHIQDVHKHFTRGSERIDVLKGVNLDIPGVTIIPKLENVPRPKRRTSGLCPHLNLPR